MNSRVFTILFFCASGLANSQAIKAKDLEELCIAKGEPERTSCTLIVKVYMDGFIEGVAKGALDTYRLDPDLLAIVKDIKAKDAARRIGKVVETATCIQRVSVAEMANSYIEYVRVNPAIREEDYRKAMTRTIISKYCGR